MLDVLPPQERYNAWVAPAHVAEQYLAMISAGEATVRGFLQLVCDADRYPAGVPLLRRQGPHRHTDRPGPGPARRGR